MDRQLAETKAKAEDIPIDGIVVSFDEIDYSRSLGRTGHHYRDGLAFKFGDELYETVLREIQWNPTRPALSARWRFSTR